MTWRIYQEEKNVNKGFILNRLSYIKDHSENGSAIDSFIYSFENREQLGSDEVI